MTDQDPVKYDPASRQFICHGDLNLATLPRLQVLFDKIAFPDKGDVTFEGSAIKKMDSAGAWMLGRWINRLEARKVSVRLENFAKEHQALLKFVLEELKKKGKPPKASESSTLEEIGKQAMIQYAEMRDYLAFIGKTTFEALRVMRKSGQFSWNSLAATMYRSGYLALPILAMLSFMIGVVIAYQMGIQLLNYGANVYIVDFLGLAVLREFGPLLTAIMVAGRTGSAFTAQIGIMKLNQEISALDTMGVTPSELLVIPRIIGLVIVLPLLTMWSNIFAIIGGMTMAINQLNLGWVDFLHRFTHVIPLKTLIIGLGKAPVFALIIASVGCFQGMQVEGGAESVGSKTTRSVVLAIFFIIVADAAFSVIFSKLKL